MAAPGPVLQNLPKPPRLRGESKYFYAMCIAAAGVSLLALAHNDWVPEHQWLGGYLLGLGLLGWAAKLSGLDVRGEAGNLQSNTRKLLLTKRVVTPLQMVGPSLVAAGGSGAAAYWGSPVIASATGVATLAAFYAISKPRRAPRVVPAVPNAAAAAAPGANAAAPAAAAAPGANAAPNAQGGAARPRNHPDDMD
ncbi:MAG TPA: hypothetical protein VLF94_05975 [Chlamydiales bacterium]|nr:hypothetical protein [Chlamydiales bacterium]